MDCNVDDPDFLLLTLPALLRGGLLDLWSQMVGDRAQVTFLPIVKWFFLVFLIEVAGNSVLPSHEAGFFEIQLGD